MIKNKSWLIPIKYLTIFFGTIFIGGFILAKTMPSKPEEKEYVVKATFQEWQIILSNQDDVAKSVRDKVVQKFATQINQQIITQDSLLKQKAIQDSLKNKKN